MVLESEVCKVSHMDASCEESLDMIMLSMTNLGSVVDSLDVKSICDESAPTQRLCSHR